MRNSSTTPKVKRLRFPPLAREDDPWQAFKTGANVESSEGGRQARRRARQGKGYRGGQYRPRPHRYHGRVKALADAAREVGRKFNENERARGRDAQEKKNLWHANQTEREARERDESESMDKLVHINRVAKVVKGGRASGLPRGGRGDQKGRSASATARRARCRNRPQGDRGSQAESHSRAAARRPHAAS